MITVAQVRKSFGPVVALDHVSLTIGKGERVAFVGTNGSGKTTLLRALLGLVRVEGKITILGSDVAKEPEIALRSVAYIPQIAPPIDAPVAIDAGSEHPLTLTSEGVRTLLARP